MGGRCAPWQAVGSDGHLVTIIAVECATGPYVYRLGEFFGGLMDTGSRRDPVGQRLMLAATTLHLECFCVVCLAQAGNSSAT